MDASSCNANFFFCFSFTFCWRKARELFLISDIIYPVESVVFHDVKSFWFYTVHAHPERREVMASLAMLVSCVIWMKAMLFFFKNRSSIAVVVFDRIKLEASSWLFFPVLSPRVPYSGRVDFYLSVCSLWTWLCDTCLFFVNEGIYFRKFIMAPSSRAPI